MARSLVARSIRPVPQGPPPAPRPRPASAALLLGTLLLGTLLLASACAPVLGYPDNWGNDPARIAALEGAITQQTTRYNASGDSALRRSLRNAVVYDEMQIYEIDFSVFCRRLWGDSNVVAAGGDLAALAIAGLGAVSGNSATKSALAAASAGIVGAQAAISKDLYYQRTLPALLAQMAANRDRAKAAIYDALNQQDDTSYPLARAEIDLQVLQRQSGIADAIETITAQATQDKATAEALVDVARTASYSTASSATRIRSWLYPHGTGTDPATGQPSLPDATRLSLLQGWVTAQHLDLPVQQLLTDAAGSTQMATVRQQAIGALGIP
jgi:hypothetical protein